MKIKIKKKILRFFILLKEGLRNGSDYRIPESNIVHYSFYFILI